jgi:site-specific DNA-methyltransferase (adenine-specific)
MEGMKQFPDGYFDLAIVDPPYGIGVMSMTYTKEGHDRRYGSQAATRKDYRKFTEWDKKPDQSYFDELFRVSKRKIIWGGNYFSDMLPPSKSFVVWDKRGSDAMKNAFADCEYAWADYGVARMFRYVWNGMIQGNMKTKEERFHPTQKPVALYEWLLNNYAKPGDKILDTHVGSASSLVAFHNLGYKYVGFELDPEYFRLATERLENAKSQTSLFERRDTW